MHWIRGAWAVLEKDARLEWRSRYALNMLLMFVLSSVVLVLFAKGQAAISARMEAGLLWIVVVFAASVGLGRAFVAEEERGTVLLLQLNTRGSQVFAGKLVFNVVLLSAAMLVALAAFLVLLSVEVREPGLLAASLALGALGLAGATTLLAAIIARTANQGPLLPVLLFPLLVPLLLSTVSATRAALPGGAGWDGASQALMTLVGFAGVVVTAGFLLFDYVWEE